MKSRDRVNQWLEDNYMTISVASIESLVFEFEEAAKDQRGKCAIKADALYAREGQWMEAAALRDVILNATGEDCDKRI